MSKIEITQSLIASLLKPENKGYVLCDSWYSFKDVFKESVKYRYSYIGALKTNRIIYSEGHKRLGIKLHKFAQTLNINDFSLVTVENKQYYIYNYVGDLKDIKNISIVFSYPKDSFQEEGSLKTFISLDASLEALDILTQYTDRWVIEHFFRDCKSCLGLNGYQVRSEKGFKRYLLLMIITYTYCKLYSNESYHFNTGFKLS